MAGCAASLRTGALVLIALIFLPVAAPYPAASPVFAQSYPFPETMLVPAGAFIAGSNQAEREAAYGLDERAYGHSITRRDKWYENELPRTNHYTGAYFITRTPITNAQYAAFIAATGHASPDVTAATWESYGLIHPYSRTRRHAWNGARPPLGRNEHPVVLLTHTDARDYAAWLSRVTGTRWRLPSEKEWEKAARGLRGARYPWGDAFDAARVNSADAGPFDTVPVNRHPRGASPLGVWDMAGQVFEWTATPAGRGRFIVKGGSWDDKGCGICRPAARHSRPALLKHILIGFRLVKEAAASSRGARARASR
jgi:formylglycine-generating enzyme required for sulfatase activity